MFRFLLCSLAVVCSGVNAGGFDNSNRPFEIIFGERSAFEFSVSYIKPSVTLNASRNLGDGQNILPVTVNSIVEEYLDTRFALRLNVNDQVTCASQLERPFRFKTMYPDDALSYQEDNGDSTSQIFAPINSEYSSESFTVACRIAYEIQHDSALFKRGYFSLIAGPKVQRIDGRFSSDLTNQNLAKVDNYSANLEGSTEWGYIFGLAYEIPDIAFRASLFFHNEIHHQLSGKVYAPVPDFSRRTSASATGKTLTPRAINFRIQSGITQNWLAFLELRWGDWSRLNKMKIDAGTLSSELVLFQNDTLNYKLGLAYKMSDRLSLGGYVESVVDLSPPDTLPGVDGTNLRNPQTDRYSMALGGKYLLADDLSLALGGSYYYLKNGRFADTSYTIDLEQSHAIALSGTLTYLF